MISLQQASSIGAKLANIESALIQATGLLGCLEAVHAIPHGWQSQVNEKKELLESAALDVIALEREILR